MLRVGVAALALLLGLSLWGGAWAQGKKKGEKGETKAAVAAKKPSVPSAPQLALLVQTSVVALSQANLTGNYTVLHALAAPDFQKANPPEKLGKLFANIRKINLVPVILYSPILTRKPAIDDKNLLRLTGYYKTKPQQVLFDLLFQPVKGQWRLFGISVGTRVPQPAAAAEKKGAGKKKGTSKKKGTAKKK